MQKRGIVVCLIISVLLISSVSAFSFSDFFSNLFHGKVTGKVTSVSNLPSGLVGYWAGDGNAKDESTNSLDGTWVGTSNYDSGKSGQALKFDGSTNYIKTTFSNSANVRSALTVSAWVYYLGEGRSNNMVVSAKDSSGFTFAFGRGMSNYHCGGHTFFFSLANPTWTDYCSSYIINNNQWYFLTATYDSDKIRLYSNGVLVDTIDTPNNPLRNLSSDGGIYLGGYEGEKSNVLLDEVMVFNRVLSASEIQQIYSLSSQGSGGSGGGGGATPNCTDSDGGLNYYVKGTTSGISYVLNNAQVNATDTCVNNNLLAEYSCGANNAVNYNEYTCPNGCSNGSCLNNTTPTSPFYALCTISDSYTGIPSLNAPDGGQGYAKYNLGYVYSYPEAEQKCTDSIYNNLMNNSYCPINSESADAQWGIVIFNSTTGIWAMSGCASSGCTRYSCPIPNCTDSDGGLNYYVKGTTTGLNIYNQTSNATDYCVYSGQNGTYGQYLTAGQSAVMEYNCNSDGKTMNDDLHVCDNGCSNGACINQTTPIQNITCTDSDGGLNYYVKGNTSGISPADNRSYEGEDVCGSQNNTYASQGQLVEHYCDGIYHTNTIYTCPKGCQDGACINSTACVPNIQCTIQPTTCPANGTQTKTCTDVNKCGLESFAPDATIITCTPGKCSGCMNESKCVPYGYRMIREGQPSYCDVISGEFKAQQPRLDANGNSTNCQNNYECESNVCSSGECVDVNGFKSFFVKIICKLSNLFASPQSYGECVANYA